MGERVYILPNSKYNGKNRVTTFHKNRFLVEVIQYCIPENRKTAMLWLMTSLRGSRVSRKYMPCQYDTFRLNYKDCMPVYTDVWELILLIISVYTSSDPGDSSNLIGSLSPTMTLYSQCYEKLYCVTSVTFWKVRESS